MIVENEEQLESYKPIPKGGAKFFISLMFLAMMVLAICVGGVLTGSAVLVAGSIFTAGPLSMWVASVIMGQNPISWFREYWKRNVRGHRIWYRLDEEGEVVREIDQLSTEKIPRGKISLELYLGGWFKRPCVIEGGIVSDTTVRVKQHKNAGVVTLIDESGDRVRLFIEDALRILSHSHAPRFLDWPEIVRKLLTDLSETKQLNRDLNGEFNGLKIKRDALLIVLEQIIDQIQDTSRFGKSKEAQRLREYVENELLYYLPEDNSRRYGLERTVARRKQQEESGETEEEQGAEEVSDA